MLSGQREVHRSAGVNARGTREPEGFLNAWGERPGEGGVAHPLLAMTNPVLAIVRDPRLSPHVTSPVPAWLCSVDPPRIVWTNAAGAGLRGSASPAAVAQQPISPRDPLAVDLVRLAAGLPDKGATRLARIRGLTAAIGRTVVCACSRVLREDSVAILIVAAEPAGYVIPLAERVRRTFADAEGAIAVFSPDGGLIYAGGEAIARLGTRTTLTALGIDDLAHEALSEGRASGSSAVGPVELQRIGSEGTAVVLAILGGESDAVTSMIREDEESSRIDESPVPIASDPATVHSGLERRHPLRFVWRIDAEGRFTLGAMEFAEAMGGQTLACIGRPWNELATELGIDPDGRVEHAIASRDTWSGILLDWPVEGGEDRLSVELSGLPLFDRDRTFCGYRGFGVCRDVARLAAAIAARGAAPASAASKPHVAAYSSASDAGGLSGTQSAATRQQLTLVPPAKNVVPFRGAAATERRPALSAVEQTAFEEIGEALTSGLPESSEQLTKTPEAPPEEPAELVTDQTGVVPSALAPGPAPAAATVAGAGSELALRAAEAEARELRSILDTATDGVIVLERDGRIVSLNRSAEALFGYESSELVGKPFGELFAPESRRAALDYLDGLSLNGVASVLNDGREVIGRVREGGLIPLFMTMGRIAEGTGKFCAVLRDITQWKRAEEDLLNAKREAERASSAKSDFLAKISHEIRTPLNAIIGFSEVMMDERFGPVGNERYRQYLRDIHASGGHLVSLLNDLLDLSKIEAGKLDLTFASVDLTALLQQCVAIMQPQANRERIIIRTSLLPTLPAVVVDERSIRQIVLNLLSNSIKFTGAGGQVIVSTALTDRGEAVLRVRDTGVGMSEKEIETALEPFRQLATSTRWGSGGTGLGLPLTKALVEANRASFTIKSAVNAGTLVEITFPATRVLAE
jgi:PAS domain S-box-containing protein